MSDYLVPEEILIEILLKLPVKSLIRGTSVCKQWRSLIRSPSFISTHLSKSKNQNQALLGRYDHRYRLIPKRGPFVLNSDSEFEFPFKRQMRIFRMVGSCDGLVCVSNEYKPNSQRIIIWNPAITNHVQPQIVKPNQYYHVVLGFGVGNNVYKVVRLVYRRNCYIVPPQAEIFCLGTGRWRELTGFDHVKGLVPQYQYPWCPYFFEGFVHWIACGSIIDNTVHNSVFRFHVGDEVFGEIMLPQELEISPVTSLSLAVMGESLGAFKIDGEVGNPRCDVWMMKDYGVKESWTKLYTIDTSRFVRVIGFRGSNEALLTVKKDVISWLVTIKKLRVLSMSRLIGLCVHFTWMIIKKVSSCSGVVLRVSHIDREMVLGELIILDNPLTYNLDFKCIVRPSYRWISGDSEE